MLVPTCKFVFITRSFTSNSLLHHFRCVYLIKHLTRLSSAVLGHCPCAMVQKIDRLQVLSEIIHFYRQVMEESLTPTLQTFIKHERVVRLLRLFIMDYAREYPDLNFAIPPLLNLTQYWRGVEQCAFRFQLSVSHYGAVDIRQGVVMEITLLTPLCSPHLSSRVRG